MKIESFDHALPHFYTPPVHGKDPDKLLELERSQGVLENILRWEDDGGKIIETIETNEAMLDQKRKNRNA